MMNRDKIEREVIVHGEHCDTDCISWGAVIAGALIAIGLGFLLQIFSLAINLHAYTTSTEGTTAFFASGFISMTISTMIVLFFAGWVISSFSPIF